MKKILFFLDSMLPAGGIERVVSNHLEIFCNHFEVHLVTKDKAESFYNLDKRVNFFSLNIRHELDMTSRIKRFIKIIKNILLVRKNISQLADYDYYYVAHIRNLIDLYCTGIPLSKIIVTEHGSYYAYNALYKSIKKLLYKKVKFVATPTKLDHNIYIKQNINSIYIPNPVDTNEISAFSKNTQKQKIILHVARFTAEKRQAKLIQAWLKICGNFPDWKLRLIGQGESKPEIEIMIKDQKSIEILKPTKEINREFAQASIFALTSKNEGFGMVLVEAMANGIPCISFDVASGPRDIIDNNKNGFLIRDNDVDDFSKKISTLIKNKELRMKFSKNAKLKSADFSKDNISKVWDNVIKDMK